MRHSLPIYKLPWLLVAIVPLACLDPEPSLDEEAAPLVLAPDPALWTATGNVVPMCWHKIEGFGTDVADREAAKLFVQQAIFQGWAGPVGLTVTWGNCPTTGSERHVRAYMRRGDGWYNGTTGGFGLATLTTPAQRANDPGNSQPGLLIAFPASWNDNAATRAQLRGLALHEFGHILGFAHERQHPDGSAETDPCYDLEDYSGGVVLGPPDPKSIMGWSYCATANSARTTLADIRSAQQVYARDPAVASDDQIAKVLWHEGRKIELHISDWDGAGWASIDYGNPGDRVWLDRSYDRGKTWNAWLGYTEIPASYTGWRTAMFRFRDRPNRLPHPGKLRACGARAGSDAAACTAWFSPPPVHSRIGTGDLIDFDGDDQSDVFSITPRSDGYYQWQYSSGGTGSYRSLAYSSQTLDELRFGDFDNDGRTDVFTSLPRPDGNHQWYFSSGGVGNFQPLAYAAQSVRDVGLGDFDGDGRTDVFAAVPTLDGYRWYYSPGGVGSYRLLRSAPQSLRDLRFGDFDADGRTDVFTAWYRGDGNYQWYFSSGGAGADQALAYAPQGLADLRLGDFEGDGRTDVFVATPRNDGWYQWRVSSGGELGFDDLAFGDGLDHMRLGDFDGDHRTDVFTSRARPDAWFDWYASAGGSASFQPLAVAAESVGEVRTGN